MRVETDNVLMDYNKWQASSYERRAAYFDHPVAGGREERLLQQIDRHIQRMAAERGQA